MKIKLQKLVINVLIVVGITVVQSCTEKDDAIPSGQSLNAVPSVLEEIENLGFDLETPNCFLAILSF